MPWDLAPQMAHSWALLGLLFGTSELESVELKVHCSKLYWQHNGLS